jgi:hypothetical protein
MKYNKAKLCRLRKASNELGYQLMVKTREKIIRQREEDEAIVNFVTRQAQEAILAPNIPDVYKDLIVNAAIRTIQKVAEGTAAYASKPKYGRRKRRQERVIKHNEEP